MMLQLNLTNGTTMTIDLINDSFVEAWAQRVVKLKLAETEHSAIGSSVTEGSSIDQHHYNIKELCRELPIQLKSVGLEVPAFFPSLNKLLGFDTATYQHHMNQIHRWLVFCMLRTPYEIDGTDYIPNNINDLFDNNFGGMLHVLFTLNQLVHNTECGFTSPGANTFPSTNYGKTMWDQAFQEDDKIGWAKDLNYKHLLTNNNHDVWLAKRILGKDFRECWLDADDPSYQDIKNIGDILHYCFEVDPLNDDSEFYYSKEFKQWMNKHNRSTDISEIGRIPLGNIINKPADIEHVMNTCSIESLELV